VGYPNTTSTDLEMLKDGFVYKIRYLYKNKPKEFDTISVTI
jgi:hypothetical protein